MIAPARRAAYEVMRAVSTRRSDLPDALAATRDPLPDERDRALVTTLVTGTLRWRNRLDWLLRPALSRDLTRLDPEVLDILRLGLFQLLFLSRVPASAVVDDQVNLTRLVGKSSAAGMVNAVLRRLSRTRDDQPLPSMPAAGDAAPRSAWLDALSITGSHPRWLVERWIDRLGAEAAAAWVAFDNTEPALTLRANTLRISREALARELHQAGVETVPLRFAPDGLQVTSGNPLRAEIGSRGLFVVQDEASQIVPLMAGTAVRHAVLDACASPGGKTLVLAPKVPPGGLLVAGDRRPGRIALVRRRLAEAGAAAVRVVALDLEAGAPFGAAFDLVMVDAPCTGLGTIRRDVDIRWRRLPDHVPEAARLQSRMLKEAAALVAPGGRLLYATCSSEPEENGEVVADFLASHPGFSPADRAGLVESGVAEPLLDQDGYLVTRPDLHGLEMFFAAALDRRPAGAEPDAGV
jgi:16S rRNA (cytosine967-C5)-methyltransferase